MISTHTLDWPYGYADDYNTLDSKLIIYSKEKNTLISVINKNCSYSLEYWVTESENTTFARYNYENIFDVLDQNNLPTVITILRDPVSRCKSAIDMLCEQYKYQGLSLSFENFVNLEYALDPHLVPQSMYVPVEFEKYKEFLPKIKLWTHLKYHSADGWNDFLKDYNLLSKLSDKHVFFYMKPGQSLTKDLSEYLDEPDLAKWWNNSADFRHVPKLLPKHYTNYLEHVYREDYRLINSVKFENI